MSNAVPFIVGIGGTQRESSASAAALRYALARAAQLGATTELFTGPALRLPLYDQGERSPSALAMIAALRDADGVIVATPSYHGSVSGLVKNALDYTEDLREDARAYLSGRAVGAIVCADGNQAMGSTLATVRSVVHALRGWPTPFSAVINTSQRPFTADGECKDAATAQHLWLVAEQVVEFATMRKLYESRGSGPR
ncbi:FMN reductase [Bradyrhizobium sp. USDA 4369]